MVEKVGSAMVSAADRERLLVQRQAPSEMCPLSR
jgi:hypothetical protein